MKKHETEVSFLRNMKRGSILFILIPTLIFSKQKMPFSNTIEKGVRFGFLFLTISYEVTIYSNQK